MGTLLEKSTSGEIVFYRGPPSQTCLIYYNGNEPKKMERVISTTPHSSPQPAPSTIPTPTYLPPIPHPLETAIASVDTFRLSN